MLNSACVRRYKRKIPLFLLFSIPVVLPACSDKAAEPASVSGTVQYQGAPIKKGRIALRGKNEDLPTKSADIVDGKYAFDTELGLLAGEYEVVILAMRKSKRAKKRFETLQGENAADKVEDEQYIPEKYNNQTELRITLKPGENTGAGFDFKLTKGF